MPQDMQYFFDNYFFLFYGFILLWGLCGFGLTWLWLRNNGTRFPDKSTVNIRFEEKTASGRSHKTFFTRLGGARNCLNVVVTDEELWINAFFPFNLAAVFYDGIHRIPVSSIQQVSQSRDRVFVDFVRKDGKTGIFELLLKNPEKFIRTIEEKR